MSRYLLIANPASQNGNGANLAKKAAQLLRSHLGENELTVAFTSQPRHASELALNSDGFDTIIALGGDGVVHEVVNGLMGRPSDARPDMGVIPAGSGNDYAKAIGIPKEIEQACAFITRSEPKAVDIGKVNEEFFMETLSFGLDAAIAIDTMERRKKTGRKGALLYMESGINQLINHLDSYEYELRLDNGPKVESTSITFAVQIGAYYGGGFKICPDAKVDNGTFDICIAHPPISTMGALRVFLQAKNGKHTKVKNMELTKAQRLRVEFEKEPPAQIDGEIINGTVFDISLIHDAIKVYRP